MEYKISVIVPAYNSESTLPETIESILGQSLNKGIQIIIVDDGSSDSTPEIADGYARGNDNILVIHKENGGVSSARNAGLEKAEGKYCIFLDADDLLDRTSCENVCDAMEKQSADLAVFRLARFGFGGTGFNPVADALAKEQRIDRLDPRFLYSFLLGNKCWKTSALRENNITFPPTRYSEDGVFVMSFLLNADPLITGVYDAVARYRRSDPSVLVSVTRSVNPATVKDYFTSMEMIDRLITGSAAFTDAQSKEKYITGFYGKIVSTILNEFYRRLWEMDDGSLKLLEEKYDFYLKKAGENNPDITDELNRDLKNPVFSKKEIAEKPVLSIKVSDPTEEFLDSVYLQSMPLFEIITDKPGRFSGYENIGPTAHGKAIVFRGRKPADPRLFRILVILKSKGRLAHLPGFILKHAAFAALKLKEMRSR